jgi:hypothetical protein
MGYRAAAVIIKTIQSLHGFRCAQLARKSALAREPTTNLERLTASRELAGYAEICVICLQTPVSTTQ